MPLAVRVGLILFLLFHQSYTIMRRKCMVHDDKSVHPERPRMQTQTSENDVSPRELVSSPKLCQEQYIVPVAWHVIASKNGDGTVSDAQILKSMEVLNGGFKNSRLYFSVHSIQRITSDNWSNACVREKSSYMEALAITPATVLNVYTCTFDISEDIIIGNAALPWLYKQDSVYNGVVVHPGTLAEGDLAPYNHGKNLVHEVGHYFGLLHYFENERCDGLGDMVDDTPTSRNATYICSEPRDTCPDQPGFDPIHNFMGYAEDACLVNFTNGQLDRMSWILNTYKKNLTSTVYRPCSIDSVFRWSDGLIYFFSGKSYYLYNETTQSIDSDYPREISDHWRGVPNSIDGVFRYSDDITYFLKGSNYYRFNDVTRGIDSGYPKKISEFWKGVPNDIDDVIKYNNGYTYFFKDSKYYRFNTKSQSVDSDYPKEIEDYWTGIPENIDGAFTWYSGEVYFFKDENFWRFEVEKIDHNLIEQPYPKSIKLWWEDAQQFTGYSVFRECNWRTYFVSGDKYWEYNYGSQSVDLFSPRPLWNGMPSKVDAMFVWSNNYLYVFSGPDYYLFDTKTKALGEGYPQKIASFWKGVPNEIDCVFRSSNGLTYFFKGTDYYRFNDTTLEVDTSYPKPINDYWQGVPNDLDTVFYSPNRQTYFFKGNNYYRFNFTKGAVDDGYPRHVAEAWKGMLYKP